MERKCSDDGTPIDFNSMTRSCAYEYCFHNQSFISYIAIIYRIDFIVIIDVLLPDKLQFAFLEFSFLTLVDLDLLH